MLLHTIYPLWSKCIVSNNPGERGRRPLWFDLSQSSYEKDRALRKSVFFFTSLFSALPHLDPTVLVPGTVYFHGLLSSVVAVLWQGGAERRAVSPETGEGTMQTWDYF